MIYGHLYDQSMGGDEDDIVEEDEVEEDDYVDDNEEYMPSAMRRRRRSAASGRGRGRGRTRGGGRWGGRNAGRSADQAEPSEEQDPLGDSVNQSRFGAAHRAQHSTGEQQLVDTEAALSSKRNIAATPALGGAEESHDSVRRHGYGERNLHRFAPTSDVEDPNEELNTGYKSLREGLREPGTQVDQPPSEVRYNF